MARLIGFAEACYEQNTTDELRDALAQGSADAADCQEWGISASEWRASIEAALATRLNEARTDAR